MVAKVTPSRDGRGQSALLSVPAPSPVPFPLISASTEGGKNRCLVRAELSMESLCLSGFDPVFKCRKNLTASPRRPWGSEQGARSAGLLGLYRLGLD